jgi:hypothetical protein
MVKYTKKVVYCIPKNSFFWGGGDMKVEVNPKVKAHYGDPLWDVALYYFLGMCMFECIPPQTFEIFSEYFRILC